VLDGSLAQVDPSALDGLITGFRWAFGVMAVTAALCVLTSLVGRRVAQPGVQESHVPEPAGQQRGVPERPASE